MSVRVKFDKNRSQELLEAIQQGRPLPAGPFGWEPEDLVLLAGVCRFAVRLRGSSVLGGKELRGLPLEPLERREERFSEELTAAIEYLSESAQEVHEGSYDEEYERVQRLIVSVENGTRTAIIEEGLKPADPDQQT